MQSKEDFDTYLPMESSWVLLHDDPDKTIYSNKLSAIALDLGMQIGTLISLLENTTEGKWPGLLGGKTYKVCSLKLSNKHRIVSLNPADATEIASFITDFSGGGIFVLTSPNGRILAMSEQATSAFGKGTNLISLFSSSSSGAIQAAVTHCLKTGSSPDFLVSRRTEGNNRSNYSITLQRFPAPGRLILCRFSIPSVAVFSQTIARNSLIGVLLEESFCPALIIDSEGQIVSMNEVARDLCSKMWKINPVGSNFFDLIHPDHREMEEVRHEQRKQGYAIATRFQVMLNPSLEGSDINIDVSVISVPDTDQFVVFAKIHNPSSDMIQQNSYKLVHPELIRLLTTQGITTREVIEAVSGVLGADSAAYVRESGVVTIGDSRGLLHVLDPMQLAASSCGFREDGIYIHRIHSGFGVSHLVLQGIHSQSLSPSGVAVLHAASKILGEREAALALKESHRMMSTVKTLAESYLQKKEPLESMLSDLVKECRAETAVVFKITLNGNALKSIGSSGVVGLLPELPVETLNTASWACIRGETAFFAEISENDLRFSPVFPNSRSELAVPFFHGSTPEGVILLASTETEAFHYMETELIQLMATLFTSPENTGGNEFDSGMPGKTDTLKRKAMDFIIHSITALNSASNMRAETLIKAPEIKENTKQDVQHLQETTTRLGFFSRWALWWLKISVYNGSPDHKWMNPVPLLEKAVDEFRQISDSKGIQLNFKPPENDIEVCTDGAFISMIAHSLLMCILDHCCECNEVRLTIDQRDDHWIFRFDASGGSVPAEFLSMDKQVEGNNMAFALAWKLTEDLGGTVSTFSNRGKATRIIIRLKVSG